MCICILTTNKFGDIYFAYQKTLLLYEYMNDFEKFKEELQGKEKFYSSITGKEISDKEYDHVIKVWNKFEKKTMNDYHDSYFKNCFLKI